MAAVRRPSAYSLASGKAIGIEAQSGRTARASAVIVASCFQIVPVRIIRMSFD